MASHHQLEGRAIPHLRTLLDEDVMMPWSTAPFET